MTRGVGHVCQPSLRCAGLSFATGVSSVFSTGFLSIAAASAFPRRCNCTPRWPTHCASVDLAMQACALEDGLLLAGLRTDPAVRKSIPHAGKVQSPTGIGMQTSSHWSVQIGAGSIWHQRAHRSTERLIHGRAIGVSHARLARPWISRPPKWRWRSSVAVPYR